MPRANLAAHFNHQAGLDTQMLGLPAASEVIAKIRELGQTEQGVPIKEVAQLVFARKDYIDLLIRRNEVSRAEGSASNLTTESALSLVSKFLPRILGWRTVSTVADELGVHRNAVESMVKLHGKPEMVRICRDNMLYISPEGERFVRERKAALDQVEQLETLSAFATRVGVPLNHLTAFFSSRSSPFTIDIHGRARMTEQQKSSYLEHRAQFKQRKRREDLVIDGTLYRSVARVSAEQASLFARPGTPEHKELASRNFSNVRYFAQSIKGARSTRLGLYVPVHFAEKVVDLLGLTEASAALGLPKETIASWRRREPSIAPASSPRIRHRGVRISGLVEVARRKFQEDAELSLREEVPTFLSSFVIHQAASSLGTTFSKVVESLPLSPTERGALEKRVGNIPRSIHLLVSAILRPEMGQRTHVTLTHEVLETLRSNSTHIGLSPSEILELAISPKVAARCLPEYLPLKIAAVRYICLLRLGLVSPTIFTDARIISAATIMEIINQWSARNKVNIKTALSIIDLPPEELARLSHSRGEVTGKSALKVLALTRLSGDAARQRYAVQFANGPRYEEPSARASAITEWGRKMAEAPLIHTTEELLTLLSGKSTPAPDLREGCLSPTLVSSLITKVAEARQLESEKVYNFIRELLRANSPWPKTYREFNHVVKQGGVPLRFATVVGKCLLEVSDPKVVVYPYQQSRRLPNVGDLFVHSSMHDYGWVCRLEQGEGGALAVVDMVLEQRRFSFRV